MGLFKKSPEQIWNKAVKELEQGNSYEGMKLVKEAAQAGYAKAWHYLGSTHEEEAKRQLFIFDDDDEATSECALAEENYKKAAQGGYIYAWKSLGDLYSHTGKYKDPLKALRYYERAASLGITSAKMKAASMHQDGIYFPKDIEEALHWYESAWADGRWDAYAYIGEIYENGETGEKDMERAMSIYKEIAAHDASSITDKEIACVVREARLKYLCRKTPQNMKYEELTDAAYREYRSHNYGLSCELWERAAKISGQDLTKIEDNSEPSKKTDNDHKRINVKLYQEAKRELDAQNGTLLCLTPDEYFDMASKMRKNGYYNAAFNYYQKSAAMGSARGLNSVALSYLNGQGIEQNIEKGKDLLIKAVKEGSPHAAYNLGTFYRDGKYGFEQDKEKAVKYLKEAAAAGNGAAANALGRLYLTEDKSSEASVQAEKWFLQAIEEKNAWGAYNLAWMYRDKVDESNHSSDRDKMIQYYTKAANMDNVSACAELGRIYLYGLFDVEEKMNSAEYFLNKAACKGILNAQSDLASMYFYADYGNHNPEAAYYWAKRAAIAGDASAQFIYANLRGSGKVSEKNEKEAWDWVRKSAEQGYEPAVKLLNK